MKNRVVKIWNSLFIRCKKTNKIIGINYKNSSRLFLPLLGFVSLVWFLFRVMPKPSRAAYPCMRVAAPLASGFLLYIGGLAMSIFAFKKARERFRENRYTLMTIFILLGFFGSLLMTGSSQTPASAYYFHEDFTPNDPIGEAHGIFPGRVVWIHDPDATNENCTNRYAGGSLTYDDGWFLPRNNDQDVIDRMLSDALKALTGKTTDKEAWDAIFRFNNQNRGKGDVTYQEGEIIYFKVNVTSSWDGNWDRSDLSIEKNRNYGIAESNPHLVLAVLRQLINVVGVAQEDIYIGDPLKHVYKHCYDLWTAEFPDIIVLDVNQSKLGRQRIVPMNEAIMKYSDRGKVMYTGTWDNPAVGDPTEEDVYCQTAKVCDYLINIPTMKGHKRAGVTMFAKNHFGSHTRIDASHLHGGLVDPTEDGTYARFERNIYRVQVDLMGHEYHYKKGLFYLMDALYSGSEATDPPRKFQMAPFNNDWTSSIFLSLDPVAIESVGYDFLRTEYHANSSYPYPSKPAVDDYLHQAADKSEWPAGITYDPENDGTPIGSLGVHEHWNNAIDKKYTRNLGTGEGIELYKVGSTNVDSKSIHGLIKNFALYQNYPNPFNPSTTIRFDLKQPAKVRLEIFNATGQLVKIFNEEFKDRGSYTLNWNGIFDNGFTAPSGIYIYRLFFNDGNHTIQQSKQMVLMK